MRSLERGFHDKNGYLERMGKAFQEKMRIAEYIPRSAKKILDVGCADGSVTKGIAHLFPHAEVTGIDLSEDFLAKAHEGHIAANAHFERVYLRELLARREKFDAITFVSVLHEFYHYGEGITSVVKALADAYEMLEPEGKIIVRDMILPDRMKGQTFVADVLTKKISANPSVHRAMNDFQGAHGPLSSLQAVNHFLLKYMYDDNWERECPENYVPVSCELYETIFHIFGAEIEVRRSYLIPFLRDKWRSDFGFTDEELSNLLSTTLIVARRPSVEK